MGTCMGACQSGSFDVSQESCYRRRATRSISDEDHDVLANNVPHLPASLTHVRLLASVYSRVDGESRALYELLATSWVVADVRSDAGVDTLCQRGQQSQLQRVKQWRVAP